MKRLFILLSIIGIVHSAGQAQTTKVSSEQTIFAFGGDINLKFIRYVVDLTKKPNPKICYLPTASADNPDNIKYWNFICQKLAIEPIVLKVWVSSADTPKTFEETLLDMDAIVVGGGNTLNMMAIWKAQGIDQIMEKALRKGIILAGGSAGSICWFENGISDSRPVNLSIVNGLALLPYSNCPHFDDSLRRTMYFEQLSNKEIKSGYASDERSGILFKNGICVEAVSQNDINNSYYVSQKNGLITSQKIESTLLINKDAIPEDAYVKTNLNKKLKDFPELFNQETPLNAYISIKYVAVNGQDSKLKQLSSYYLKDRLSDTVPDIHVDESKKNKLLDHQLDRMLVYKDSVAGFISKIQDDFYGLWFFYYENGKWLSAGEDIGGQTVVESEITFREKAEMHLEKVRKIPPNN